MKMSRYFDRSNIPYLFHNIFRNFFIMVIVGYLVFAGLILTGCQSTGATGSSTSFEESVESRKEKQELERNASEMDSQPEPEPPPELEAMPH